MEPARKLFVWAFSSWLNKEDTPWPADLPRPGSDDLSNSQSSVLQVALGGLAFLLLHELGHIRLGHTLDASGPEEEREADYYAINFLLDRCPDDRKRSARGWACAIALSLLPAYDIYTNSINNKGSHPPSYDRLVHSLRRHFPNDCDALWFFVSGILSLHLSNSGLASERNADETPCASPYEAVERDADLIARCLSARSSFCTNRQA